MTENTHAKLIKQYMHEMSKPNTRVLPWRAWLQTVRLPIGLVTAGLGMAACGLDPSDLGANAEDNGATVTSEQGVASQQTGDLENAVPLVPAPLYGVPICFDRRDNEPNGAVDCDDKYCAQFPGCNGAKYLAPPPECTDRLDNEPNDLVDSQDPYCSGGICADRLDNEPNRATDCDDKYCAQFPGCNGAKYLAPPPLCRDGLDNEPNGLVDGEDPFCPGIRYGIPKPDDTPSSAK